MTAPNSSLPEWIEEKKHRGITHKDLSEVIEALSIAWDVLDRIDQTCTCRDSGGRGCEGCQVGDALRRIEELGK